MRNIVFQAGCTIIANLDSRQVRYVVYKNIHSDRRLKEFIDYQNTGRLRGITYFRKSPLAGLQYRFAALHSFQTEVTAMPENKFQVRIRMYRPGLGDCFLLTFRNGSQDRHILIDCGIFLGTANEKQRIRDIAGHIKDTTDGQLDALVATHEHWDHVAGFSYAQDVFDNFKSINEVWLAWTEDPDQQIVQERRQLKMQLERALAEAVQHLAGFGSMPEQECGRAIAQVMAFNGPSSSLFGAAAFSQRSNDAMEYLLNLKVKKGYQRLSQSRRSIHSLLAAGGAGLCPGTTQR